MAGFPVVATSTVLVLVVSVTSSANTALSAKAIKAVPKTAPHNVFATLLLRNP